MKAYRGNGFRVLYDVVRDQGEPGATGQRMSAADDVVRYFRGLQRQGLIPTQREAFCALLLNARHKTIGFHVCSIGSLDSATVHPREVFRPAIAVGAGALIVAHNHPTGDASPSGPDRNVTERLTEVGALLGIPLLDHLVIGSDAYFSFADGRRLPFNPATTY